MFSNLNEHWRKRAMRILPVLFSVLICASGAVYPSWAMGMSVENADELPAAGSMLETSRRFQPAVLQGMTLDPAHPLQMEFIVNPGDRALPEAQFLEESQTLIKYFLTALTVPEDRLWVNLSPYEQDRIIPPDFGETEMGRELLAQDYLLKQLSASMMYPEKELGREFWSRVHTKALQKFGTTEIPLNTFNKVWIVPETAVVQRTGSTIMVTESHMKVMLEEDYLALSQHSLGERPEGAVPQEDVISGLSAEIVRQVLIPEIEREVNEGENFARLRQIYSSLILATWYKQHLRSSVLGQIYVDQNKTRGVQQSDPAENQRIYKKYVEAFNKGVYNYIREDIEPGSQERIPRKYFSGGVDYAQLAETLEDKSRGAAILPQQKFRRVRVRLDGVGDNVSGLERLGRNGDQAILAERLFAPQELEYIRGVWRTLSEENNVSAQDLSREIETRLNTGTDEKTRVFAAAGNWMQLLDSVDSILEAYNPNRRINVEGPSNMFELAMQNILTGFQGIAEETGVLIVRVTEHREGHYRFDAVLLDRRGDFFYDDEKGRPIPIENVLSSQLGRGPRSVYGEALPMGVLATDRFSVLSVRRNGADTSEAVYWESQHQQWLQLEQGQVRFNRPPVSEGTALVLSFNLRRDDFLGTLERDRESSDAAMMSAVGYSQGIHETAVWLGNKIANKPNDEPLVIVLHGRHGVGKTFTKDLILAALEEMGYEFDETRQNRSRKAVHRYNAWRAEDKLDEAWRSNFFGHRGIVIAETVEMPVPEEWRQADNLLFIHMQANQKRRRQRIERKGDAFAGQLAIKSVHESPTELRSFANRIIIANSDIDMNKRFLSIMKFQYAFEQASSDVAMLAKTVFHRTADAAVIRDILAGMTPGKIALRVAEGQIYRVWLAGGTVQQELVSSAEFGRIHREDHNPVVIAARAEDLDAYLQNRIPRQAVIKIDHSGIYVDGIKQENIGDYHDVVHFAFARMAAETPFEKSYVMDVIVFESLFGKGVSPQDQLMTRAYEEMVVRKVENYFMDLATGRDDARERMDAQMDAVLSKVGWSPDHLQRLIALVRELRAELDRNGSLQIVHQIQSRLTSTDIPVRQHEAVDAAVLAADRTSQDPLGGIDLNPANMTLETRGDGGDFQFQFDPVLLNDLNLDGFLPVIINITPVNTLPLLLGDSEAPAGPAEQISNRTPATSHMENRPVTKPSPDKISRR